MFSSAQKLLAASGLAFALAGTAADAQTAYPQQVVTLVTHSSPGSGSDVFLRHITKYLGPIMGVNFVVDNITGGGGATAMAAIAQAPADGSIFYATTPTYIFTSLLSDPEYKWTDLDPLVNVFIDEEVLFTASGSPFQTLEDVMEAARADRGKWGASTPGSLERQAMERLKSASGVNAAIVTHDGGGEMTINVLNGTLDMGVGEFAELRPQIDGGTVRILAVFSDERLPDAPEVPTVKELGYDVVVQKFRGLAGPKGQPPEVIAAWEEGIQKVLADPEYMAEYRAELLSPAYKSHADTVQFTADFAAETEEFFRSTGVIE
jgi:tripartite-type tricarboxylate transporter receptor subunit TctC